MTGQNDGSVSDHCIPSARLAEIYSRTAAFYDDIAPASSLSGRALALEVLARKRDERLLDVGFGTGWALERVIRETGAGWVVGMDFSRGMMQLTRERLAGHGAGRPQLLLADARSLPMEAESWDCLLCTYTLDVLTTAEISAVLRELRRVLRTTGRLVTTNLAPGEGLEAEATNEWLEKFRKDPEYFGGARPLELSPLLVDAGFAISERRYSGRPGWPSETISAKKSD